MVITKIYLFLLSSILISFFLFGCKSESLQVSGDLADPVQIKNTTILENLARIESPSSTYCLLAGKDGTAALIHRSAFSEITIEHSQGNWYSRAANLPPVSGIRELEEISFFLPDFAKPFLYLSGSHKIHAYSPFQLTLKQYHFLGKSVKNGFQVQKFKLNSNKAPLIIANKDSLLVIFEDGNEKWIRHNDLTELEIYTENCNICFQKRDLAIIWNSPPEFNFSDINPILSEKIIERPTLCIWLNGLSWAYLDYLKIFENSSFLATQNLSPVRSHYPPGTNNNLQAALTGSAPFDQEYDRVMFDRLHLNEKSAFVLRTYSNPLPTSFTEINCYDENGNGTSDDEIFRKSLQLIRENPHFLLIQFSGSNYPNHQESENLKKIEKYIILDEYIEILADKWNGNVLFFSHDDQSSLGNDDNLFISSDDTMTGSWGIIK